MFGRSKAPKDEESKEAEPIVPPPTRVAVIFAAKGGFGDVGRLAAVAATRDVRLEHVSIVRLTTDAEKSVEGMDDIHVQDVKIKEDTSRALASANVVTINIDAEDATALIATAIEGCGAVVACVGNRQGFSHWCATGAEKVVAAMTSKECKRLVLLTSYGLGTARGDTSSSKVMWSMGMSMKGETKNDLEKMERVVNEAKIEHTFVRVTKLDPKTKVVGQEDLRVIRTRMDRLRGGELAQTVSKIDVSAFMLDEAMRPRKEPAVAVGLRPPFIQRCTVCCCGCCAEFWCSMLTPF